MVTEANDLEQELQRNLKLRRELGGEVRLGLLMTNGAKGDAFYQHEAPKAEGTFPSLLRTAWMALGAIGLALAVFIVAWLT